MRHSQVNAVISSDSGVKKKELSAARIVSKREMKRIESKRDINDLNRGSYHFKSDFVGSRVRVAER
jgi:hypothetical protein